MSAARVGMVHTVPALVDSFDELFQRRMPGAAVLHIVDAELLATAIRVGVTADVQRRLTAHVQHFAGAGCRAVLVTCSSIGETVATAARAVGIPVVRVDDPMSGDAVNLAKAGGGRSHIVVLATLEATLGPSLRLIESKARGSQVTVSSRLIAGAATARASGDQGLHDKLIAAAVRNEVGRAGVVALAQASMADAAATISTTVPILTSPVGAVSALARLASGE
ncbi:MAG TPA: aspartate/glutamate racemase family protein [Galbitalea sp.]|jgi:aspartate/glutamate racemase|nr:aspartate/glutamate racemase family protein [Galbitalea sp.]